jgi:signal transduction histidine kinase
MKGEVGGRPRSLETASGKLAPGAANAADGAQHWLVGGGEMARLIKVMDWSKTPLGVIGSWPQSLRTLVSLVQASNSPISLAWGKGHAQIYNDGYWPICGAKHPQSMGQDFRVCWASAWPVIGEAYETAWSGRSAYLEKMRMFLDRHGFLEETWFTFSFSPVTDESGGVGGLFHPVTEMTAQMLSERRTHTLRELASRAGRARTSEQAFALSEQVLGEAQLDLPFTLCYLVDRDARQARRVGQTGILPGSPQAPDTVDLRAPQERPWPITRVAETGLARHVEDAQERLAGASVGPYAELPRHAVVLPVLVPGSDYPAAVVVLGLSPRLIVDEAYRTFCDLVAAGVGAALANARAYEHEREKVEQLAAIDRAKTAFFGNVSHEFRTPLTLILGPIEDAVGRAQGSLSGDDLHAVHRSALRMLRLVNSLLDFARIEAGRLQASFEPTDLAALTTGLAASFRSLVESAGLQLHVSCPPLPELLYVDRGQWEQIVLNLLSNAFKFTLEGQISVHLALSGGRAVLTVSDTGTGIPEQELPRLFERFHRVEGARGRSFEGSGIGLALVQELVHLHGGSVRVHSALGRGSTFEVAIPCGREHLPPGRVVEGAPARVQTEASNAYLLEASFWGNGAVQAAPPTLRPPGSAGLGSSPPPSTAAGHILVADDNADMREYVRRLLAPRWRVVAVEDGAAALRAAQAQPPELVLSDVMMPNLDGVALLRALRADARTAHVPVLLLSARAGEEAVVAGLETGADDYLVKPFSARELLSRVGTHLELSRMRRQATEAAHELAETRAALLHDVQLKNDELESFSYSVSHDLRSPLRSIAGFSKILLEDYAPQLDAPARRHLERICAATAHMGALIDGLLALSRVGRAELQLERVDVSREASAVVAELRRSDPERTGTLEIQPELSAWADARLTRVVLDNLLGNAWKFTSRTHAPRIELGAESRDGEQVFCVRDNGAGFDMQYAHNLFCPFRRLHHQADFPGTGVGLATVQRVVQRHGGRIWAESREGHGAAFFFTLAARAPALDGAARNR